jgi:hypothetical protein
MKTILIIFGAAAALALAGCDNGTPGGPGTKNPPDKTPSHAENTFKLNVPTLAIAVKQGESVHSLISIRRERNFDEDVRISFGELPKGVTIEPANPTIKHGEDEAKITVAATGDAGLGDFTVQVTGTPTTGTAASNKMRIDVSKK